MARNSWQQFRAAFVASRMLKMQSLVVIAGNLSRLDDIVLVVAKNILPR